MRCCDDGSALTGCISSKRIRFPFSGYPVFLFLWVLSFARSPLHLSTFTPFNTACWWNNLNLIFAYKLYIFILLKRVFLLIFKNCAVSVLLYPHCLNASRISSFSMRELRCLTFSSRLPFFVTSKFSYP